MAGWFGSAKSSLPDTLPATLEFYLVNATAQLGVQGKLIDLGARVFDCAQQYEIISVSWLNDFPSPPWVKYQYRWGPDDTETDPDPSTLRNALHAAFGDFAYLVPDYVADEIGSQVGPKVFTDDLNGPVGPWLKKTWNGDYSD